MLGGPGERPSDHALTCEVSKPGAEVVAGQHFAHRRQRGRHERELAAVQRSSGTDLFEHRERVAASAGGDQLPCRSPRLAAIRIALLGM